ncbi:MAG: HD domain-containing protein [Minisyncoccia bacterium]|jgi:putative hydrolase of HD superfamily
MKNPDVARTAAFIRLLHSLQSVERVAAISDLSRRENDVEHSYFLVMVCWYLCDTLQLDYSKEKVFRYALVHDLVEIYSGDTFFLDAKAQETKKEREESARVRIANEFPEFKDLHAAIKAYEHRNDPEAGFVYAIDKVLPFLINYMQGGYMWKEMGVAHEDDYANKREKIGEQKEARELLEQIIALIGDDWGTYFVA